MHLRGALDELHVERAAGHGVHTADPTAGLEERPRLPVPPGVTRRPPPIADLERQHGQEQMLIHRPDGRIRGRNSYGNDPHPPKG